MAMAYSIEQHLHKVGVDYSLLHHPHTHSSLHTAHIAHLPAREVVKAVLCHDRDNYLLCVIPASHRIVFHWLNRMMNGQYQLASEDELESVFLDCEMGAVPALGQVYGFHVIWDDCLQETDDIYLESGDHEHLIHLNHGAFMQLMGLQEHMTISCPEEEYSDHLRM
ncbi:hypothetical protein A9Q89_07355 [Gammaproteobacteria bacterium 53_120_T64]|nr:hypothetical protein A9Q89_07355 [Gammaproteobacteria bacterium 53_120_T64]